MADNQARATPPPSEVATASDALRLILSCMDENILITLRDSVGLADLARLHDLVGSRVFTELVNFGSPPGENSAQVPSASSNNDVIGGQSSAAWELLPEDGGTRGSGCQGLCLRPIHKGERTGHDGHRCIICLRENCCGRAPLELHALASQHSCLHGDVTLTDESDIICLSSP